MSRHHEATETCQVCGLTKQVSKMLPADLVRSGVAGLIRDQVPAWSNDGYVCLNCLNGFRTQYVQRQMEKELGELDSLETEVARSLQEHELLAQNLNEQFDQRLTFGQRVADRVAEFGGSWAFIFTFAAVLLAWIVINSVALIWRPFDPFPYILLNLVLSMLAAIQAPVIMMSQNRQEARDRLRAESDYKVNLKAEMEVRLINEKLDQLIHHQWSRLIEIQEIQMDMIEDLARPREH
ncbi:MAG: DUF1003 domain-containing protein [Gammaproteobacteria bacterium]